MREVIEQALDLVHEANEAWERGDDNGVNPFLKKLYVVLSNALAAAPAARPTSGEGADVKDSLTTGEGRAVTDAERLDWLQSEHDRFDPVAAFTVKFDYDRDGGRWANVCGNVREAIDKAMHAALARTDELGRGSEPEGNGPNDGT